MFGFLKDNKPEILKQINNAISEEKIRLHYIKEDILETLSSGKDIDVFQYSINIELGINRNNFYEKKIITVDNASSREMFQSLNKISPDSEYNVDNDTVHGTVKGYRVFMMRHKGFGKKYIGIGATYKDIKNYVQNIVDEYNTNKSSTEVPNFINEL